MTVDHYIANHLPKMRRICWNVAQRFRMDRDDHLQNCLINAIRLQKGYVHESETKFFGWWSTLCYNQAINVYRKEQKNPPMVDAEWAAGIPGGASRLEGRQRLAMIYRSLRYRFGTKFSLVMYLTAQRYKYEEIADALNIPVGTVRSTIHRCRKYLKPENMAENEENNSVNRVTSEFSEVIPGISKRCRGKCGLIKSTSRFSKHSGKKDGLQDICKDCTSDFMRDYNARKAMARKQEASGQLTAGDVELVRLHDSQKAENAEIKREIKNLEKEVVSIQRELGDNYTLTLTANERKYLLSTLIEKAAIIDSIIKKL